MKTPVNSKCGDKFYRLAYTLTQVYNNTMSYQVPVSALNGCMKKKTNDLQPFNPRCVQPVLECTGSKLTTHHITLNRVPKPSNILHSLNIIKL